MEGERRRATDVGRTGYCVVRLAADDWQVSKRGIQLWRQYGDSGRGKGGLQFMQWTQAQSRDVTVWVTYGVEAERMRWPVLQIVNYLEM